MGRSSVLIAAAAIALLFHFTGEANAFGGGSGPSCLQGSAGGNVGTITGTATVDVINYGANGPGLADAVDATLWLTWKGKSGVFRTSLSKGTTAGVTIISPEDLLCKILANDPYNTDTFQFLSQTVGVANSTSLYITNKSITVGGSGLNPVPGSGNYTVPCSSCPGGSTTYDGNGNFSAIAAVTIYVPGK